ncbi:hypothetical protein ACFSKQ_03330 [Aureimonas populi]|uniref:Uncharacterized protein n=2 Tax=Aureimonas populi TaxID=1701758 RepID=A0ABW5CJW8_9HYPH
MNTTDDKTQAMLERLRDTLRQIERMLQEDRQSYFEALARKASGASTGNVTAQFFSH